MSTRLPPAMFDKAKMSDWTTTANREPRLARDAKHTRRVQLVDLTTHVMSHVRAPAQPRARSSSSAAISSLLRELRQQPLRRAASITPPDSRRNPRVRLGQRFNRALSVLICGEGNRVCHCTTCTTNVRTEATPTSSSRPFRFGRKGWIRLIIHVLPGKHIVGQRFSTPSPTGPKLPR